MHVVCMAPQVAELVCLPAGPPKPVPATAEDVGELMYACAQQY